MSTGPNPDDWDVYDVNVKPTRRWGWWLMVMFAWDALFRRIK